MRNTTVSLNRPQPVPLSTCLAQREFFAVPHQIAVRYGIIKIKFYRRY